MCELMCAFQSTFKGMCACSSSAFEGQTDGQHNDYDQTLWRYTP